jgi:hypothetical protein
MCVCVCIQGNQTAAVAFKYFRNDGNLQHTVRRLDVRACTHTYVSVCVCVCVCLRVNMCIHR